MVLIAHAAWYISTLLTRHHEWELTNMTKIAASDNARGVAVRTKEGGLNFSH